MTKQDYRKQFITWLKRSSWHPCRLDFLLEQEETGEFVNYSVEQMYNAYCAGILAGMKIQKSKNTRQ